MRKMSTSFILEPGYPYSNKNECTVQDILEVAKTVSIEELKTKCIEYGVIFNCVQGCTLDKWLEKYKYIPTDDLTCWISEEGIHQSSSSGTGHREQTEQIRRAFGILVLDKCYKKGMSVSFRIV